MKRYALALAAIVAAACLHQAPQPPNPTFGVTVRVVDVNGAPIPNPAIKADGLQPQGPTVGDSNGRIRWDGFRDPGFNVCAERPGYHWDCASVFQAGEQTVTITLQRLPEPPPPPVQSNAGERGRIHVEGTRFVREDGSTFPWYGFSDFSLFQRYTRGEDLTPLLDERIALGVNVLRVFGMYVGRPGTPPGVDEGIGKANGLGPFDPSSVPNYLGQLGAFADMLAARGLRFEFVIFADAQILMPRQDDQRAHLEKVGGVLTSKPNAFCEVANEPFKNGVDVWRVGRPAGVVCASGSYDVPFGDTTFPHFDYQTTHSERKDDWPRTARAIGELRDGFDWRNSDGSFVSTFRGVGVPVVGDEPTGFAEVARGDSRSDNAADAAYFAATAALMGAGSTFHSDDGIASRRLGPVQTAAARAWFAAARFIPAAAQFAPYMRGGAGGGPGIGDMPIEHHDLDENVRPGALRSFAKVADGFFWAVRIRPVGPTVTRRGCTIVEEPILGLLKLACPN